MAVGTALALTLGAAALGQGLKTAGNVAQARAGFTSEEARRLAELQRARARGDLGLTSADRSRMESRALVDRGAALRDIEALSPVAPGQSARDVFAGALGTQTALTEARRASARDISEADQRAAEAQRTEIASLAQQKVDRKTGIRAALLGGTGELVSSAGAALAADVAAKQTLAADAAKERSAIRAELDNIAQLQRMRTGTQTPGALPSRYYSVPPSLR